MTRAKAITATKVGLCNFGGYALFTLGFAGIFLPLLPTTIFWIMAVWMFSKTHPEMMAKIYNWPKIGFIVEDFVERGVVNSRSKKAASFGIIGVGGLSLVLANLSLQWSSGLLTVFVLVLCYIWTRPAE